MSTHTIQTEIEVEVLFPFPGLAEGDYGTAYPTLEITFDYERGYVPGTLRGEYGPIDPPVVPHISFRDAKLIKDDDINPDIKQVQEWAERFLAGEPGRVYAIECAELDLKAMRHAHLEDRRDQ